jgi:MFS family permease
MDPTAQPAAPTRRRARGDGLDWKVTAFVALAVFAQEVTWNFYDAQVPPLLDRWVTSSAVIGLLMGMDNLLGVFIQPWIGNVSDRTRTRRGRRVPFLLVAMPLAAVFFVAIPHATSLPVLVTLMLAYAVVANSSKPVAEALMPDFVRREHRSRANAVVKIGASITIIVSSLISVLLVDDHPKVSFAIPAAIVLLVAVLLAWRLDDSRSPGYRAAVAAEARSTAAPDAPGRPERAREVLVSIVRDSDRSRLYVLLAVFAFAGAWAASRALLTNYGIHHLDMTRGDAGGLALPGGLAFLAAALPMAFLAERIGRVRTIAVGMTIFIVGLLIGTLATTPLGTTIALCVAAVGYAGFAINAVVVLWSLSSVGTVGTYTGIFTIGTASGSAAGPALVGALVDVTGWSAYFMNIGVLAVVALVLLQRAARHIKLHGNRGGVG